MRLGALHHSAIRPVIAVALLASACFGPVACGPMPVLNWVPELDANCTANPYAAPLLDASSTVPAGVDMVPLNLSAPPTRVVAEAFLPIASGGFFAVGSASTGTLDPPHTWVARFNAHAVKLWQTTLPVQAGTRSFASDGADVVVLTGQPDATIWLGEDGTITSQVAASTMEGFHLLGVLPGHELLFWDGHQLRLLAPDGHALWMWALGQDSGPGWATVRADGSTIVAVPLPDSVSVTAVGPDGRDAWHAHIPVDPVPKNTSTLSVFAAAPDGRIAVVYPGGLDVYRGPAQRMVLLTAEGYQLAGTAELPEAEELEVDPVAKGNWLVHGRNGTWEWVALYGPTGAALGLIELGSGGGMDEAVDAWAAIGDGGVALWRERTVLCGDMLAPTTIQWFERLGMDGKETDLRLLPDDFPSLYASSIWVAPPISLAPDCVGWVVGSPPKSVIRFATGPGGCP